MIYFPQPLYPSEKEIRADYETNLRELAEKESLCESEKGYVSPEQHIASLFGIHRPNERFII